MQPLLLVLRSVPAFAGLVAALALAVLFWLYGPLIGLGGLYPFEGFVPRLLLASLPVIVFLAGLLIAGWRRAKRDRALVEEAAAPDPAIQASAEEEAALKEKLTAALAQLRQATGGKGGYLYELPWYVFIGPPGSGKTTAIAQSGLEFPLADGGRVAGVGGTRNCDWWLTDRAVLIDTAGRYTTQDSDAAADKAGWDRFLAMLRRNRPRQPLNGVLVCFGVDMLSRLDVRGRADHARAVRKRIRELEDKLGQRLPVYLLISKADLLTGFTEFFDDLDKETRTQVWGMTFPLVAGPEGAAAGFAGEFAGLLGRLQDRLLERLQAERGTAQRAAIMGFPRQVASLGEPVGAFIAAAFGGTRLDPAPMLRGVYFASGTQEGTPIDRLTGALSRAFGLDPRRPAGVMGQKGRSFFLGRLLREVVFNEARLAARDRGAERRRQLVAIGAWCLALVVTLGGLGWAYAAYNGEQDRAAALEAALARAEGASRAMAFDPVTGGDLGGVLPYLDAARPLTPAARTPGGGLGLSQEAQLVAGTEAAYRRVLDRVLLPRLLAGLEVRIRANFQRPDYLYEATRVYLMLGREGPLDQPLVREWLLADWQRDFPGATGQPQREALLGHLDAMLARDFPAYPLDGALVDGARRVFSRLPMAERVYSRLRPLGQPLRAWAPAEALGPAGLRYFTRASGQPLTEGVAGLYTIDGLYRTLLPALGDAVRAAAAEAWVLGPQAQAAGSEDPVQLEAAVLRLYAEDYARAWQTLLDDLVLPPFRNLTDAAEGLNLLGAPTSPIRDLLRGAARQLSPGTPPDGWTAPGAGPDSQRVQAAQGQPAAPTGAEPVASIVEQRFQALRAAAGQPLDGVLAVVSELYVQVARLASSPPGTVLPAPAAGLDPGQRLLAEAARQPQPLARWLTALGQSTAAQRSGGAKAAIAAAGGQALGPICRMLGDPRNIPFPFNRNAAQDMPVDDFARLFGPGGALDLFFAQWVRPYVDTTQKPWRLMATAGLTPPVTQGDVLQFERAQAIRDAFFPGGAMMGGLRFEVVPQGFDPEVQGAILEVEGSRYEMAAGGPGRPVPLSWPTRGNLTLNFEPPASIGPLALDSGWSAFKLVTGRQARLQPGGQPARMRATITQGDRSMMFELRTGSTIHPFGMRELQEFRCPTLAP
jgi:type VI secretion system protein ImpL